MTFKIGDVVRLKSGGPKMTIGYILGDMADLHWFDGDGIMHGSARLLALEPVVAIMDADMRAIQRDLEFQHRLWALQNATSPKIAGAVEDLIAAMLKRA